MGKLIKILADIFKSAKEKGLKDVSIRIHENLKCILYVGSKDRWVCNDLDELLQALTEHKGDLSWMND